MSDRTRRIQQIFRAQRLCYARETMPIPIEQHIRLAELRKKLEGKLKITDSGPDSLGVELLPGNDDALLEFHQLLDLLKEIMRSKTTPQA